MATKIKKTTDTGTGSKFASGIASPIATATAQANGAAAGLPATSNGNATDLPLSTREAMKKRELIELAVQRSGLKKRDVKPAIEAALAVMGDALAEGREINMRPMGKIKILRMKKGVNGQVINARIRQPEEVEKTDVDPLAQDAD